MQVINSDPSLRRGINALVEAYQAHRYVRVSLKTGKDRSADQNAMLHALFAEAAKKCDWHGRKLTETQWKVLFISGHAIATGRGAEMIPGLEGEFVNIRESSARMSVARMNSLIEYVQAWMAQQGVKA